MDQKLIDKLEKRKSEGTLRSLSCFEGFIDFYSNDYLGLARASHIVEISNHSGATGSRLISGNSIEAEECEKALANFYNSEAALVYNSGYDANVGLFSSILQRGDTILYDEAIHASVRDGIRLSFASAYSFEHNSLNDLRLKLERCQGTVYIAVESLYSMNGDLAPLKEIAEITSEYNAYLIVDEAHSGGVFGTSGRGYVEQLKLEKEVFARLFTFGKAYGLHGAAILGSPRLKDYLLNFSRSFIYTTALPPAAYERIQSAVLYTKIEERQVELSEKIRFFREKLSAKTLISHSNSPIQMIRIGSIEKTKRIADELQMNKLAVKPIYSPTVKLGEESIRVCIHAHNSETEIELICNILNQLI
jgi:8-amino-7-oxononanoate synthase